MAYSAYWFHTQARQHAQLPALRATADRWVPQIEEFVVVDLAPGRAVVMPPLRPCPTCWQQGRVFEPGPLGLIAVLCPECLGAGRV